MNIDEVILQHSTRGMDILQKYHPKEHCKDAVNHFSTLEKGTVFLYTGFYINLDKCENMCENFVWETGFFPAKKSDYFTGSLFFLISGTEQKFSYGRIVINDNNIPEFEGQIVKTIHNITDNKITINKENLQSGIYLIKIDGEKLFSGRLIIK